MCSTCVSFIPTDVYSERLCVCGGGGWVEGGGGGGVRV